MVMFLASELVLGQDYTSSSKKAIRHFEKAMEYFNARDNTEAIGSLQFAIEQDTSFVEAYILLATIYTERKESDNAINAYRKSLSISPDYYPPNFFNLGTLELSKGYYSRALESFVKFLSYPGFDSDFVNKAEHNRKICVFALESMKHPVPFEPINLGGKVNSAYDEYFPGITADDKFLLFTRRIKDKANIYGEQEDFFVSLKKEGQWTQSRNLGPPINTHHNEGSPTISPDGQLIIFSACEEVNGYGSGRKGFGSCDIFFVKKIGESWSSPLNIGPPISSPAWDVQPSYSSDGTTLYFVSQRKGGLGSSDIWVSSLTPEGVWGDPENLGKVINTEETEEAVFIHPDNQTLYFASNGHVGMGGLDIFMSKREEDGKWGPPENLGYPINTFNDENGLIVGAEGDMAFFSSNREGGQGGLDLYSFPLHEKMRPVKVTYVKGKVFDSATKQALGSRFELIDLLTGKVVVESYSNKGNGKFLVCLPVNNDYALNVSRKGYVFFSENFSLKSIGDASQPFAMDVPLQKIRKGANVVLKNIFFETGSFLLKDASKIELKKVVLFMRENPNVKIEIGGHTDNVGDENSNQLLSENRAKTVYEYLALEGIEKERLSFNGYGEGESIASNNTEKGRAKNRRTEFKIIEL
jgi:outer membrane protein OmpA-like peptidoglycan-associated protein/tetratricopeptide (TPR) repeat protein